MAVSVVVPISVITALGVTQVASLVSNVQQSGFDVGSLSVDTVVDRGTERINSVFSVVPGGDTPPQVSKSQVKDTIQKGATEALQAILSVLKHVGLGIFGFISTFIVAIFLIMGMLRYQERLVDFIRRLSPFDQDVVDIYIRRTVIMTKAMVKGQFVIAFVQGVASAVSLWIVGVDYFWFFVILLTFLSFIPLGGGILTIPIGIILMLTGNIWQGIFVILWHIFVVSNIDNVLRPRLVPEEAHLDTALMLLAVFAGIGLFGAAGVVYGPVVMILIVSTLQLYATFNQQVPRISLPQHLPRKSKSKA